MTDAFESGYELTTLGQSYAADLAADAAADVSEAIGTGDAAELTARLRGGADEASQDAELDDDIGDDFEGINEGSGQRPEPAKPQTIMRAQPTSRAPRKADADSSEAEEEAALLAEADDEIDQIGTDDDPDGDEPDSHDVKIARLNAQALEDERERRRSEFQEMDEFGRPLDSVNEEGQTAKATRNLARLLTQQRSFHEGRTDRVDGADGEDAEDRSPSLRDPTLARPSATTPEGKAIRTAEKFMREHGMVDELEF